MDSGSKTSTGLVSTPKTSSGSSSTVKAEGDRFVNVNGKLLRSTNRTSEQHDRLQEKHRSIYIHLRCEAQNCDVTSRSKLSACSLCKCVFYCSKEHQKCDWKRHKLDCKKLTADKINGIPYSVKEQMALYPLGCFPCTTPADGIVPDGATCFVCGAGKSQCNMKFTKCCGLPICDNEFEYEHFSWSKDFCARSHERYTLCADHIDRNHKGDWRMCQDCICMEWSLHKDGRAYMAFNGYNVTPATCEPASERYLNMHQKGSLITAKCATCNNRILNGFDSVTTNNELGIAMGGTARNICSSCNHVPGPPGQMQCSEWLG